jgi:hypothetical protein
VHDALALVLEREVGQRADLADVAVEGLDLLARDRVEDALLPVVGGRVVVGRRDDGVHAPGLAPGQLEALEGLRAGDFVNQVAVDVDQRGAVVFDVHHVAGPQFFVERLRLHGRMKGVRGN